MCVCLCAHKTLVCYSITLKVRVSFSISNKPFAFAFVLLLFTSPFQPPVFLCHLTLFVLVTLCEPKSIMCFIWTHIQRYQRSLSFIHSLTLLRVDPRIRCADSKKFFAESIVYSFELVQCIYHVELLM